MRKAAFLTLLTTVGILSSEMSVYSDAQEQPETTSQEPLSQLGSKESITKIPYHAIQPFTGKVIKNKVRLRLHPSLDSPILRELNRDDLLVVLGELDDFYAIQVPENIKGYVFRTYILDGIVEGNHVNIRIEPDLNAPIVAQLNTGERIQGSVSPLNSKWLEISLPEDARLYVSKEFIEKIGDRSYLATLQKRRAEVEQLLNTASQQSQEEMKKSYEQIKLDHILGILTKITTQYSDFPEQVIHARNMINVIQDRYLQKKIAYLESKANRLSTQEASTDKPTQKQSQPKEEPSNQISDKMALWLPTENKLYESWKGTNDNLTQEEFYQNQSLNSISMTGIIEPYLRTIKNKPGDYVLVSQANHMPIAYLYSTLVNLQNNIGQLVTIEAVSRPNNNFAYPAYFVLSVQ